MKKVITAFILVLLTITFASATGEVIVMGKITRIEQFVVYGTSILVKQTNGQQERILITNNNLDEAKRLMAVAMIAYQNGYNVEVRCVNYTFDIPGVLTIGKGVVTTTASGSLCGISLVE